MRYGETRSSTPPISRGTSYATSNHFPSEEGIMDRTAFEALYDFSGKVAVVTGAAGALCAPLCRTLASLGARVAVVDIDAKAAGGLATEIEAAGGQAASVECDVLDKRSIEEAARQIYESLGSVDILVNGAGGNKPEATTSAANSFFDLP